MRIAAVIGSGPCISDIRDRHEVSKWRETYHLNRWQDGWAAPDVLVMQEFQALRDEWLKIDNRIGRILVGRRVHKGLHDFARRSFRSFKAHAMGMPEEAEDVGRMRNRYDVFSAAFATEYQYWDEEKHAMAIPMDCALAFCLGYLVTQPIDKIELYGIDLPSDEYRGHRRHVSKMLAMLDVPIVNCCPSSEYKDVPQEAVPWTTEAKEAQRV